MDQDPYTILGVSRDATDEEIKTAYRNLAKKYHPDRNPDDPNAAEKMNQINAAYDAIKDGAANYYSQGNGYSNAGRRTGILSAVLISRHISRRRNVPNIRRHITLS